MKLKILDSSKFGVVYKQTDNVVEKMFLNKIYIFER